MDKSGELVTNNSVTAFIDRPIARAHKFYLTGEIKNPSEYIQWFETIRNSSDSDVIVFHINSHGGDLFTAIQFMRVLSETKANIVASVEGACMSAATLIFLSAKNWEISNHSMFMFHNYSGGTFGKGGEMYDQISHFKGWGEKLLKDIYSKFLTPLEIKDILNNKDVWMSGEEVSKRLKKKLELEIQPIKSAVPRKKTPAKKPPAKKTPAKKTAKTTTRRKKTKS